MTRKSNFIKQTEGAAAIIIALAMFALIGVASLAIDMGQLYTIRNQLQNVADASALAGVSKLIEDQGGQAVRNSDLAKQVVMQVAQSQSQLDGLAVVADGARDDLNVHFGVWDLYVADRNLAWTDLGESCASDSNANAMQVTITRAAGTVFGPVTNLFAQIMGYPTSTIAASATAYLGYTSGVPTGAVEVPLTLPTSILNASNGRPGWFASILGTREAVASTTKTYVFKDTAGKYVNSAVNNSPTLDSAHAYLFTVNSTDSVPGTILDILTKVYNPGYTSSNPVLVAALKVGQEISARSEFKYGTPYIGPIFQRLQWAYNYKTTGNRYTAPAPGTAWRVTLPVYAATPIASQPRKESFMSLARLLAPFWASEAYACYTVPPPKAIINGFVNADITNVTYSSSGDDGNYTYPKTINSVTYTDKKDFLTRYPDSVWNVNTATIKNVTDASTVSPPGSVSGGPSAKTINSGAPASVGAFATSAKLVK